MALPKGSLKIVACSSSQQTAASDAADAGAAKKQMGQTELTAPPAHRTSLVHCCWLMWSAVFPILCGRTLSPYAECHKLNPSPFPLAQYSSEKERGIDRCTLLSGICPGTCRKEEGGASHPRQAKEDQRVCLAHRGGVPLCRAGR